MITLDKNAWNYLELASCVFSQSRAWAMIEIPSLGFLNSIMKGLQPLGQLEPWRPLFPFLSSLRIDLTQLNHWHIHYPSVPNMQMQYSSTSLTALWTLKVNLFVFVLFFQFEYTGHFLCCQYKHLVYVKDLKKFGSWLVYC